MKPKAILIAGGLWALVQGLSFEEKLQVAQEVALETFLEQTSEPIVRCVNLMIEQADREKRPVTVSFRQNNELKKLTPKERLAMERLFDLQGRKISFLKDILMVHPDESIREVIRQRETSINLFHPSMRRRIGFSA